MRGSLLPQTRGQGWPKVRPHGWVYAGAAKGFRLRASAITPGVRSMKTNRQRSLRYALRASVEMTRIELACDFIGKLVALIPKPRHNLVRYYGVLAPNAKLRPNIVPATNYSRRRRKGDHNAEHTSHDTTANQLDNPTAPLTWAQRL